MSIVFLVFHPQLLYLDKREPLTRQIISPAPPIWFGEEVTLGEYVAEQILDSRVDKQKQNLFIGDKGNLMYKTKITG